MNPSRVTFDFTVDEAAEVHLASIRTSREASSWRRREQVKFVAGLILAVAAMSVVSSTDRSLITVQILVGVVVSLVLAIPFGWYYDHLVRRRTRRLLLERLGGAGPHECSIEICPETLRVIQAGIEIAFPWADATGVKEAPDGVTITFRAGLVLARARGFASEDHRLEFLRRVRERLPSGVVSPPAA